MSAQGRVMDARVRLQHKEVLSANPEPPEAQRGKAEKGGVPVERHPAERAYHGR